MSGSQSLRQLDNDRKLRILIVEDSSERQAFLLRLYQRHEIVLSVTCAEAIAAISKTAYDIIHLDFDLTDETTTAAADFLESHPTDAIIIIHSDNPVGTVHLQRLLPKAMVLPISTFRQPGDNLSKFKGLLAIGGRDHLSAIREHLQSWSAE